MNDRTTQSVSVILVLSGVVGMSAYMLDATPKHSVGFASIGFLVMTVFYAFGRWSST